ncbi:MAG: hypothetical protein ABI602_02270 [Candidatus Saccharibacteria bacterium]
MTAIVGGLLLIAGLFKPPQVWLVGTIFSDYVVPGTLLAGIVGGSALAAAVEHITNKPTAASVALLSGFITCAWIVDEIALIQQYSWLQLVYFTLGGLVISLSYTDTKTLFIYRHQRR